MHLYGFVWKIFLEWTFPGESQNNGWRCNAFRLMSTKVPTKNTCPSNSKLFVTTLDTIFIGNRRIVSPTNLSRYSNLSNGNTCIPFEYKSFISICIISYRILSWQILFSDKHLIIHENAFMVFWLNVIFKIKREVYCSFDKLISPCISIIISFSSSYWESVSLLPRFKIAFLRFVNIALCSCTFT